MIPMLSIRFPPPFEATNSNAHDDLISPHLNYSSTVDSDGPAQFWTSHLVPSFGYRRPEYLQQLCVSFSHYLGFCVSHLQLYTPIRFKHQSAYCSVLFTSIHAIPGSHVKENGRMSSCLFSAREDVLNAAKVVPITN